LLERKVKPTIRLLRLMPNEDETAPVQCKLFDYSLHDSRKGAHLYEALSYVDEHDLPVTTNLYAALSHLRDRSVERIIWVDAICIKQPDRKERGRQVQIMAKIYSKAHRVIVWLGETTDNSDRALEEIRVAEFMNSSDNEKT
jgi:hypothetical protein